MTCETEKSRRQEAFKPGTVIFMYIIGTAIRYWLLFSRYQSIIGNHIEVSTPLNSWKRVSEGLFLQSKGINPYDGDLLHEAPLSMLLYKILTQSLNLPVEIIFLIADTGTALLIYCAARRYMFQIFVQQEANKQRYAEDSREFLLSGTDFVNYPVFVAAAFLFNPYTIFNCVGLSTTVIHNFLLALFLVSMLHGSLLLSTYSLAFCTMMSLYPGVLIIPLALSFMHLYKSRARAFACVIVFAAILLTLKHACTVISNGDQYLKNVYGFILTVPDLQPNIGLFWYFFTEMFDHFRELFIYSFQINATILYLVPLSIKFRKDPFLLTYAILFLTSVFKSYPCLGDIGFVLSLLPCFIHLFYYSQQGFIVGVIFLVTTALGPILWHLWIYSNSANANFYFGVTLAFAIAQIFLVTDILFAYLKREFRLQYGKESKIDGKDALLILE